MSVLYNTGAAVCIMYGVYKQNVYILFMSDLVWINFLFLNVEHMMFLTVYQLTAQVSKYLKGVMMIMKWFIRE